MQTGKILAGKLDRCELDVDWERYPFYHAQALIASGQVQYKFAEKNPGSVCYRMMFLVRCESGES
jgi:hypothetical protein